MLKNTYKILNLKYADVIIYLAPKPHSKVTENLISSRKRFLIYGNLRKVECIEIKRLSRSKMKIIKLDSYFFNVYAACLAVFKVGYGAPQSELGEAIETNTTGRSAEQIQDLPRPDANTAGTPIVIRHGRLIQKPLCYSPTATNCVANSKGK